MCSEHITVTFPLCRHSEEMIEKLESAGLGFYVRATETQQKLGNIIIVYVAKPMCTSFTHTCVDAIVV